MLVSQSQGCRGRVKWCPVTLAVIRFSHCLNRYSSWALQLSCLVSKHISLMQEDAALALHPTCAPTQQHPEDRESCSPPALVHHPPSISAGTVQKSSSPKPGEVLPNAAKSSCYQTEKRCSVFLRSKNSTDSEIPRKKNGIFREETWKTNSWEIFASRQNALPFLRSFSEAVKFTLYKAHVKIVTICTICNQFSE